MTGARIGEVRTVKWTDFDFERGAWIKPSHHTKQKRTEYLPLSASVLNLLSRIKKASGGQSEFVFPGISTDKPLGDLKRFWQTIKKTADLKDYRIHDNRHTFASHLVSGGQSLPVVGRLMGHTNPATTQRYAHLADDPLREAANQFGDKYDTLTVRPHLVSIS